MEKKEEKTASIFLRMQRHRENTDPHIQQDTKTKQGTDRNPIH